MHTKNSVKKIIIIYTKNNVDKQLIKHSYEK